VSRESKDWHVIKQKLEATSMENLVTLSVGGKEFQTNVETLTKDKNPFFTGLFSAEWQLKKDEKGRIFINRNGKLFSFILDYLQTGEIAQPKERNRQRLISEANFYHLDELVNILIEQEKHEKEMVEIKKKQDEKKLKELKEIEDRNYKRNEDKLNPAEEHIWQIREDERKRREERERKNREEEKRKTEEQERKLEEIRKLEEAEKQKQELKIKEMEEQLKKVREEEQKKKEEQIKKREERERKRDEERKARGNTPKADDDEDDIEEWAQAIARKGRRNK